MTRPDIRGIGLVLLDRLMTFWLGSQHGPGAEAVYFPDDPAAQRGHLDAWAPWRRARARAGL